MSEILISTPDATTAAREGAEVVALARSFEVLSIADDIQAQQWMIEIARMDRAAADFFAPSRTQADRLHKQIVADERRVRSVYAEARNIFSEKSIAWKREQERLANETRQKAEEEARAREEERRLMDAIAAEDAGENAEAEAILTAPIIVEVPEIAPETARVEGVSARVTWYAEVTDLAKLTRFIADNPQWIGLIEANQPALNRLAISMRENLSIPGVEPRKRESHAVRTR